MTPKIIDTYKFKFCKGTIELHKPGYKELSRKPRGLAQRMNWQNN